MSRKITKADVKEAYDMAAKAKQNAAFSMRRAKVLKDGADRMHAALKRQEKRRGK